MIFILLALKKINQTSFVLANLYVQFTYRVFVWGVCCVHEKQVSRLSYLHIKFSIKLDCFFVLNTTGTVVFVLLHETVYLGWCYFLKSFNSGNACAAISADLWTKIWICQVLLLFGACSKTNLSRPKHRIYNTNYVSRGVIDHKCIAVCRFFKLSAFQCVCVWAWTIWIIHIVHGLRTWVVTVYSWKHGLYDESKADCIDSEWKFWLKTWYVALLNWLIFSYSPLALSDGGGGGGNPLASSLGHVVECVLFIHCGMGGFVINFPGSVDVGLPLYFNINSQVWWVV